MNGIASNTYVIRPTSRRVFDTKVQERLQIENSLPKTVINVFNAFGLLSKDETSFNTSSSPTKFLSCSKLKTLVFQMPILILLIEVITSYKHLTFVIGALLDYGTYYIGYYSLLYRRNKVIYCIENMLMINSDLYYSLNKNKSKTIPVLLGIVFIYAFTYFTYSAVWLYKEIQHNSPQSTWEYILTGISIYNWIFYCFFTCIGTPAQGIFLVYISSIVYDILLTISKRIESVREEDDITTDTIRQQRLAFCKLQRLCSESDSIFNEIIFVWLVKIIIRCCLSAIDILTRPWNGEHSATQIFVLFDIILDISHLLTLSHLGGKIEDAKCEVIESLIHVAGKFVPEKEDLKKELHFIISTIGRSDIGFTAAKIFPLNRATAVNILGALGSYYVLIYQFTLK